MDRAPRQDDTITVDLTRDQAATKAAKKVSSCTAHLRSAEHKVSSADHFDALHVEAFDRALASTGT